MPITFEETTQVVMNLVRENEALRVALKQKQDECDALRAAKHE